jgi:alkane 1-monooxygenase
MDPRVIAHFEGDLTRANLDPRKRERILAAHPAPAVAGAPTIKPAAPAAEPVAPVVPADVPAPAAAEPEDDEVLAARCPGCEYTYEVAVGNELEGFAAGTAWAEIPDDWCCPDCGVREKVDFVALSNAEAR